MNEQMQQQTANRRCRCSKCSRCSKPCLPPTGGGGEAVPPSGGGGGHDPEPAAAAALRRRARCGRGGGEGREPPSATKRASRIHPRPPFSQPATTNHPSSNSKIQPAAAEGAGEAAEAAAFGEAQKAFEAKARS